MSEVLARQRNQVRQGPAPLAHVAQEGDQQHGDKKFPKLHLQGVMATAQESLPLDVLL